MKVMLLIFATVFVAEIGDKTQLATMLFSAEGKATPVQVFLASAAALVVAAAIGVAAGQVLEKFVSPQVLKVVATDPGSVKDFEAFSRQTGNELLSHARNERKFTFFMKRK